MKAMNRDIASLQQENQALREQLARLRNSLHALRCLENFLDGGISPEMDMFSVLDEIVSAALEAVDSENGSLQLVDQQTGELVFVEVQGPNREQLLGYRLPPGEGIAGWVVKHGEPVLVDSTHHNPHFTVQVDHAIGFQTETLICVPLTDRQVSLGVIEVVNTRSGKPFNEYDLDVLTIVARLAAQALLRTGTWLQPGSTLS